MLLHIDSQIALVRRHMDAEVAQDIDAVMRTLVDIPYYEIHPLGLRIQGKSAVREMYKRLLPGSFDHIVESRAMTFNTGDPKNLWSGPDGVVIRESCMVQLPDGERFEISEMAIFSLEGESIRGEQFYCNGPLARLFKIALGEEFKDLPGVERMY
jgi:hypothetical protein